MVEGATAEGSEEEVKAAAMVVVDLAAVKEGAGKAVDLEVEEKGEGSAAVVMGAGATAEGLMAAY